MVSPTISYRSGSRPRSLRSSSQFSGGCSRVDVVTVPLVPSQVTPGSHPLGMCLVRSGGSSICFASRAFRLSGSFMCSSRIFGCGAWIGFLFRWLRFRCVGRGVFCVLRLARLVGVVVLHRFLGRFF